MLPASLTQQGFMNTKDFIFYDMLIFHMQTHWVLISVGMNVLTRSIFHAGACTRLWGNSYHANSLLRTRRLRSIFVYQLEICTLYTRIVEYKIQISSPVTEGNILYSIPL